MSPECKLPTITTARGTTVAALLILASCFGSIANQMPAIQSSKIPFIAVLIVAAMGMTGLAVWQWVLYFREYLDFRINPLRQTQPEITSSSSPSNESASH
jgi:hypothetical protein